MKASYILNIFNSITWNLVTIGYIVLSILATITAILFCVAKCYHARIRGSDPPNYLATWTLFINIANLLTNAHFCLNLYQHGSVLWIFATVSAVFSQCLSIIACVSYVRKWRIKNTKHLQKYDTILVALSMITGFYPSIIMFSSKLFYLPLTSLHLTRNEMYHLPQIRFCTRTFFGDGPFITLQILFMFANTVDQIVVVSLVFSILSWIVDLLTFSTRIRSKNHHLQPGTQMSFQITIKSQCFRRNHQFTYFLFSKCLADCLAISTNRIEILTIDKTMFGLRIETNIEAKLDRNDIKRFMSNISNSHIAKFKRYPNDEYKLNAPLLPGTDVDIACSVNDKCTSMFLDFRHALSNYFAIQNLHDLQVSVKSYDMHNDNQINGGPLNGIIDSEDLKESGVLDLFDEHSEGDVYEQKEKKNELCDDKIDTLIRIDRLRYPLHEYMNSQSIDNIDVLVALDDFIYLLAHYNHPAQFEFIHMKLGSCDIESCEIFEKHYNFDKIDSIDSSYMHNIMRKIHCYYAHSFHIGLKLSSKDRKIVEQIVQNNERNNDEQKHDDNTKCFNNDKFKKIKDILDAKKKGNIDLKTRMSQKYAQFTAEPQKIQQDDKTFSFGTHFDYGVFTNNDDKTRKKVTAKYANLKEELTQNSICQVGQKQFLQIYNKAKMHFDCNFRKQNFSKMTIHHTLSLIVYCDYTKLQYEFSKTYRQNVKQHECFFHWGRLLKDSVLEFGTTIEEGIVKQFYHGIAEKLSLPSVITDVKIYSPLSTSSSIEVATNFANNGFILEFKGGYNLECKYFSVQWLSDYGNEDECLFIQNQWFLKVTNIIDVSSGNEYVLILTVLDVIDKITRGVDAGNINSLVSKLIIKIIHHQLSYTNTFKHPIFKSLDEYSKRMIDRFCKNKKTIKIDYSKKNKFSFLDGILFVPKEDWIELELLHALFPNMEQIEAHNTNLSAVAFINTLKCLHGNNNIFLTLSRIAIKTKNNDKLEISSMMSRFDSQFSKSNFTLKMGEWNDRTIYIERDIKLKHDVKAVGKCIDDSDIDSDSDELYDEYVENRTKAFQPDCCIRIRNPIQN
eukprot:65050_1